MQCGPKTLDELLELVPGLRRCRSLSVDMARKMLDRRKKECTWCGSQCPGQRRHWCSQECETAFLSRCCPAVFVAKVVERDKHICQICNRDVKKSIEEFRNAMRLGIVGKMNREDYGYGRGAWYEIDHIIPVSEGGGLCDISNLRFTCGQCHKKETAKLAKRRMNK